MMFDPARLPYTINKFLNWNSSDASTSSLFMHSSQYLIFMQKTQVEISCDFKISPFHDPQSENPNMEC